MQKLRRSWKLRTLAARFASHPRSFHVSRKVIAQARGLVLAAHRYRINDQQLANEAFLKLYALVADDDCQGLARLVTAATEA